jgi:hypothetical protein
VATLDLSAKNLAVLKAHFVYKLSSRPWVNLLRTVLNCCRVGQFIVFAELRFLFPSRASGQARISKTTKTDNGF